MWELKIYKINHDFSKRPMEISKTLWKTRTYPTNRVVQVAKMFRDVFGCEFEIREL